MDQHLGQPAEQPVAIGEGEDRARAGRAASEKRTGVPGRQTGGRRTEDQAEAAHLEISSDR